MDKYELISRIENFASPETQEPWDCSGWLVDGNNNEVNKVMLALNINDSVISQAKAQGCDLVIAHHPLFYVPIEYKDIQIYCAHTNLDEAKGGTTDTLIEKLNLDIKTINIEQEFVRICELAKPICLSDLSQKLKQISKQVRLVNNYNTEMVTKIAFCAGSGSEFIDSVDVDAYVTGDVKYHCAEASEKVIFDIGHFESEILVL